MDLTGTIPSELNLLTPLKLLDLSYSPNLIGSLPESLSFANLQALYLEHTGIEGPLPTLMDSLTDLRISFTPAMQQYGLPSFLYHLTKLEWIEWSQNQTELTRSGRVIPTELGLLTELQGLLLGKRESKQNGKWTEVTWSGIRSSEPKLFYLPVSLSQLKSFSTCRWKWIHWNNPNRNWTIDVVGDAGFVYVVRWTYRKYE